jgi:hypothetical protein
MNPFNEDYAAFLHHEITKTFEKYIIPIFWSDNITKEVGYEGTGLIFKIDDMLFCATAWHVIKNIFQRGALNIVGFQINQINDVYKDENLDIAFFTIPKNDSEALIKNGKNFVELNMFLITDKKETSNLLVAHGYPADLTQIDPDKKMIYARPFSFYASYKKVKHILKKNEISLGYSNEGWQDTYKRQVKQMNVHGMSGCPIIECNIIRTQLTIYNFKIIGIALRWHDEASVITGILISSLFKVIAYRIPELENSIEDSFGHDWKLKL